MRKKRRNVFSSAVNVRKIEGDYKAKKLMSLLAISFGLLTSLIIFISYDGGASITGYSVLENAYGRGASLVLVGVLLMVIFIYSRISKE